MDLVKERITQVLDNQGVLTRLKAELRANVFLAINDQDVRSGGAGLSSKSDALHKERLLADPSGVLLVELVRELLVWCKLQFTLKVFEPEMQLLAPVWDRSHLEQQLGLSGRDGPLLLQLLNHHLRHEPQQGFQTEALGAAALAGSSSEKADILQQQHLQANSPAQPTADAGRAGVSTTVAPAAMQQSMAGSVLSDIDDDLIHTNVAPEASDEEYAAVFLAAQRRTTSSEANRRSSSSSGGPSSTQQKARPVHSTTAADQQENQTAVTAAEDPALSDSFGHLDSSPMTLSLDLQGLSSPPSHQTASSLQAPTTTTAVVVGPATAAGAIDSPREDEPGGSNFITSSSSSIVHQEQQQEHVEPPASALAATAAGMGRLAPLEPLAPLRPNKLAPLPVAKVPSLALTSISSSGQARLSASAEDIKEELRRAGLISPTTSSPGANSSYSPRASSACSPSGAAVQHAASPRTAADSSDNQAAASAELGSPQTAVQDRAGAVYGSTTGAGDSSDDDSDDFGLSAQQLFAAARRQLSQSGPTAQQVQQQQLQGPAKWDERASVVDSEDIIDDIPEDFSGSLPTEDLDDVDLIEVYNKSATGTANIARGTNMVAGAGGIDHMGMSLDLHDTGLSLSERLGEIAQLNSTDLVDEDDF